MDEEKRVIEGSSYILNPIANINGYLTSADEIYDLKLQKSQAELNELITLSSGVSEVQEFYAVYNSPIYTGEGDMREDTTNVHWVQIPNETGDEFPVMNSAKPYLWNYEKFIQTGGSVISTEPHVTGVLGRGYRTSNRFYLVNNDPDNKPSINADWKEQSPPTTDENPYLWEKQVISYTDNGEDETIITLIGVKGEPGIDGTQVEYIFCFGKSRVEGPVNPTPEDFESNSNYQKADYIPSPNFNEYNPDEEGSYYWSDEPVSVSKENPAQWICKREFIVDETTGKKYWGAFSDPKLYSTYGEDGVNIVKIETWYLISESNILTPTIENAETGDDTSETKEPETWYKNSPAVSFKYRYLWKKTITEYSAAIIDNPDTESNEAKVKTSCSYEVIGSMGDPGIDGDSVEWIYTRTMDGGNPPSLIILDQEREGDFNKSDYIPHPRYSDLYDEGGKKKEEGDWIDYNYYWSDDIQAVDKDYIFGWRAQRKKTKNEDGTQTWKEFTTPVKILQRAADGVSPNAFFKSIIFIRSNEEPEIDSTTTEDESGNKYNTYENPIAPGWSDGIPEGTETLWSSTRIFSTDGKSPQQESWTEPKVMTDTPDVEIIYCGRQTATDPNNITTHKFFKDNDGNINPDWLTDANGRGWFDEPDQITDDTGAEVEKTPIWMAISRKTAGQWSNWEVSRIKGERGNDGTSIKISGHYNTEGEFYDIWVKERETNEKGETIIISWYEPGEYNEKLENWSDYTKESSFVVEGNLWVWDGSDEWINAGQFKGDPGKSQFLHVIYASSVETVFNEETGKTEILHVELTEHNGAVPGKYIATWADETDTTNVTDEILKTLTWTKWLGEDGYGYEYIYKLTKTNTPPHLPTKNSNESDFVPTPDSDEDEKNKGWTDNPQDVSKDFPYCWQAYRVRVDGIWQNWKGHSDTEAALWSKFGKDGRGISSISSIFCIDDIEDYETFIENSINYPPFSNNEEPGKIPTDDSGNSNASPKTWYTNSPSVTDEYPYLWKRTTTEYTEENSDGTTGLETQTVYELIGVRGANGVDGTDIEWAYILTKEDICPTSNSVDYFYVEDETTNTNTTLSTSELTTTPGENKPKEIINELWPKGEISENIPGRWTDDPQDVSDEWPYQWVVKRTKVNNVWSEWGVKQLDEKGDIFYKATKNNTLGNSITDTESYYIISNSTEINGLVPSQELSLEDYKKELEGNEWTKWAEGEENILTPTPVKNRLYEITIFLFSDNTFTISGPAIKGMWTGTNIQSTVFCRSSSVPATPTGGTYDSPEPNEDQWTDGIPPRNAGDPSTVWSSTGIFEPGSMNGPRDGWSKPLQLTDTASLQIRYCSKEELEKDEHGNITEQPSTIISRDEDGNIKEETWDEDWTTVGNETSIWMATRSYSYGTWDDWQIMKIKGETGESPYIADLDNEMDSIGLTKDGYADRDYTDEIITNVSLWHGSTALQLLEDINEGVIISEVSGISCDKTYENSRRSCKITFNIIQGAQISERTAITITLKAKVGEDNHEISKDLVFTLNGVKAGADGSPAKLYRLQPSVNKIIKDNSKNLFPETIFCNATLFEGDSIKTNSEIENGVKLKYYIDDSNEEAGEIGLGESIPLQSLSEDLKSIKFVLLDSNDKILDSETVVAILDGSSPIFADLDNEMDSVALDHTGKVETETIITTNVGMWKGTEPLKLDELNAELTTGISDSIQVSSSISSDDLTKGIITCKVTGAGDTKLLEEKNIVTITLESGGETRYLTLTINGIKAGQAGENATLYRLAPSSSQIIRKNGGTFEPNSLTIHAIKTNGKTTISSETPDSIVEGEIYYYIDGNYIDKIAPGNEINLTGETINNSIKLRYEVNEVLVDTETIPIVRDGQDGVGSITVDMDNEMDTIALDTEGKPFKNSEGNYDSITTNIRIWLGTEEKTISSLEATDISGFTKGKSTSDDRKIGTITFTPTGDVIGTRNESTIIVIDDEGIERYIKFTISAVRAGLDGITPKLFKIQTDYSQIKRSSEGYTPTEVNCKYLVVDGENIYEGNRDDIFFRYYIDGTEHNGGATIRIDSENIGTSLKLELIKKSTNEQNNEVETIVDVETIPVLFDGSNGTSPIIADLDNEMDGVNVDSDGYVLEETRLISNFWVNEGNKPLTIKEINLIRDENLPTDDKLIIDASSDKETTTTGTLTVTLKEGLKLEKQRYTIKPSITVEDSTGAEQTKELTFTINVVRNGSQGIPGKDSYVADLDNEMDSIALTSDGKAFSTTDTIETNVWVTKGNKKHEITKLYVNDTVLIGNGTSTPDEGLLMLGFYAQVRKNSDNSYKLIFTPQADTEISTKTTIPIKLECVDENGSTIESNLNFTINGIKAAKNGQDGVDTSDNMMKNTTFEKMKPDGKLPVGYSKNGYAEISMSTIEDKLLGQEIKALKIDSNGEGSDWAWGVFTYLMGEAGDITPFAYDTWYTLSFYIKKNEVETTTTSQPNEPRIILYLSDLRDNDAFVYYDGVKSENKTVPAFYPSESWERHYVTLKTVSPSSGVGDAGDVAIKSSRKGVATAIRSDIVNSISVARLKLEIANNQEIPELARPSAWCTNREESIPTIYRLLPSVKQVIIDKDGKYSVDKVTINATATTNGVVTENPSEVKITYYINNNPKGTTVESPYLPLEINTNKFSRELKLELIVDGEVKDVETISLVSDGLTAKPNLLRNTNFDIVDNNLNRPNESGRLNPVNNGLVYYFKSLVSILPEEFNGYNVAKSNVAGHDHRLSVTLQPGKVYTLSGYGKNTFSEGNTYPDQVTGWVIQKAIKLDDDGKDSGIYEDSDYLYDKEFDFKSYENTRKGINYFEFLTGKNNADSEGKTKGSPTIAFGYTPNWEFKSITFKYNGTVEKQVLISTLYVWSSNSTGYIACIKLEESEIATPYIKHSDDYRLPFKSTVFKRHEITTESEKPDTPEGGTYNDPVPNDWSDGIPSDSGKKGAIFSSTRTFYVGNVDTKWSEPQLMADGDEFDVCYSTKETRPEDSTLPLPGSNIDNDNWTNTASENAIWMATSSKSSGETWSAWTVTRIKGEKGDRGAAAKTYKLHVTDNKILVDEFGNKTPEKIEYWTTCTEDNNITYNLGLIEYYIDGNLYGITTTSTTSTTTTSKPNNNTTSSTTTNSLMLLSGTDLEAIATENYEKYSIETSEIKSCLQLIFYDENGNLKDSETIFVNSNGTSPYFADITNEMDSVALDASGKVVGTENIVIETKVSLWHGSKAMPITGIKFVPNSITGITITPEKEENQTNYNGNIKFTIQHGVELAEKNSITITLTSDDVEKSVVFTLNGVKAGADGSHAKLYRLVPSANQIVKLKNDSGFFPKTISCSATVTENGNTQTAGNEATIKCWKDNDEVSNFSGSFSIDEKNPPENSIKFEVHVGGKIMDTETIPVIKDGDDLKIIEIAYKQTDANIQPTSGWVTTIPTTVPGKYIWTKITYSDGNIKYESIYTPKETENPITADLDNEMDSVALDYAGVVQEDVQIITNASIYDGSTKLTPTNVEVKSSHTDLVVSETGDVQVNNGQVKIDLKKGKKLTKAKYTFTITITANDTKNTTVNKTLIFALNAIKAAAAAPGLGENIIDNTDFSETKTYTFSGSGSTFTFPEVIIPAASGSNVSGTTDLVEFGMMDKAESGINRNAIIIGAKDNADNPDKKLHSQIVSYTIDKNKLQPNTWYTYSFYVKKLDEGNVNQISFHIYSMISEGISTDGIEGTQISGSGRSFKVTNSWTRHYITFKTVSDLSNMVVPGGTSKVTYGRIDHGAKQSLRYAIAMPKLEIASDQEYPELAVPSAWCLSSNDTCATLFKLEPSVNQIIKYNDNDFYPTNVKCNYSSTKSGTVKSNRGADFYYILDGGEKKAYTAGTEISTKEFSKTIKFILEKNGVVQDSETISIIPSGKDGLSTNPNLLKNSNFDIYKEDGNLEDWELLNNSTVEIKVYNGFNAVKRSGTDANNFLKTISPKLTEGIFYTLSFYYKCTSSVSDGNSFNVTFSGGTPETDFTITASTDNKIYGKSVYFYTSNSWRKVYITFKSITSKEFTLTFYKPAKTSEIYISQPKLEEGQNYTPYTKHQNDLVGPAGKTGRNMYPAGNWDYTREYKIENNSVPFVFYDDGSNGGKYYILTANEREIVTGFDNNGDLYPPTKNTEKWGVFTHTPFQFSEFLMANWAKFGGQYGAVFYDRYLFSQRGHGNNEYQNYIEGENPMFNSNGELSGSFVPKLHLDFYNGLANLSCLCEPFITPAEEDSEPGVIRIKPENGFNIKIPCNCPSKQAGNGVSLPMLHPVVVLPNLSEESSSSWGFDGAHITILFESGGEKFGKLSQTYSSRIDKQNIFLLICSDLAKEAGNKNIRMTDWSYNQNLIFNNNKRGKYIILSPGSMVKLKVNISKDSDGNSYLHWIIENSGSVKEESVNVYNIKALAKNTPSSTEDGIIIDSANRENTLSAFYGADYPDYVNLETNGTNIPSEAGLMFYSGPNGFCPKNILFSKQMSNNSSRSVEDIYRYHYKTLDFIGKNGNQYGDTPNAPDKITGNGFNLDPLI